MNDENATTSQEVIVDDTTTESAPAEQTTSETETAPADVSTQPVEGVPSAEPRAEKRIHELSKRLKESESRADYWERINAKPVPPTEQSDSEFLTADQIADTILYKQQVMNQEKQKAEANKELQVDISETLIKHPDLESNDKLSRVVFSYAQANGMRISDAADEIKSQIKANEEKVKKEILASQSGRIGVTTPSGGRVSNGSEKIDFSSLSPAEKSANWGKILQSYQN
jgi:hypothetical protein